MTRPEKVVVVGASLAGLNAVQAARAAGYEGELVLVGDEPHLPYDRPPLSKGFLRKDGSHEIPHLPGAATLDCDLQVELRLGEAATHLDVAQRIVRVGKTDISYDAIIIATGAHPRSLPGGERLAGVHCVRTLDHANALRASMDAGQDLVVVGGGFIGCEVAPIARERGLTTTILEAMPTPLEHIVGKSASRGLMALHARHGVNVECGVQVESLEGEKKVEAVRLDDGRRLPADVVVVAIGVTPATFWLEGSGLLLENGVVCDATLNAGKGVWAAGDIARWPNPFADGLMRIEHWTNAVDQGRHAMLNALAPQAATPYRTIPYFWSDWYDSIIQFAGAAVGEPTLVAGSWDGDSFAALYAEGPRFRGVLTLNRRGDIMKYRALLDRGASTTEALALAQSRVRSPSGGLSKLMNS